MTKAQPSREELGVENLFILALGLLVLGPKQLHILLGHGRLTWTPRRFLRSSNKTSVNRVTANPGDYTFDSIDPCVNATAIFGAVSRAAL